MNIIAFSDSHGLQTKKIKNEINNAINKNKCDILICAGDFSSNEKNFIIFLEWFSSFKCKKILIAGNHEKILDQNFNKKENINFLKYLMKSYDINYLENESIIINGIKFFGSPYSPYFTNMAFMKDDIELDEIWNKIDKDTDILITHTPCYGILDKSVNNINCGSLSLLETLSMLKKLKIHIFGHIHFSYGYINKNKINFYNVSLLDKNNKPRLKNKLTYIKI